MHLELGGNDATIVCDDADVAATADALIAGRFTSGNGQICCAVKRVLVEKPIYQKLLDAVAARAKTLRVGDPMDPATDVGPLINRRGAERVEAQVRQAVADGAKIVTGGKRRDNFFEPTDPDRRHARHAGLRRGDLRAGAAAHPLRAVRGGAGARQ